MRFSYNTAANIQISVEQTELKYSNAIESVIDKLNQHRGAIYASSYEYPGRYTCWDIGFYNPPLALTCRKDQIDIQALNQRGEFLITFILSILKDLKFISILEHSEKKILCKIIFSESYVNEEERSHNPSVFSVLRAIISAFKSEKEPYLGLYGAFAYDLILQFESLEQKKARDPLQRDMVLYIPDELYIVNHRKEEAFIRRYDFDFKGKSTHGIERVGRAEPYQAKRHPEVDGDFLPEEYSALVDRAKKQFICGNLFEVVPSRAFYQHYAEQPADLFRKMRQLNPSPYGFLINLGEEEYLVGASPEMYVRVQGKRIETCPISGTVRRGRNAIEDAANIEALLSSEKESSELTMCTDVDRNDKSRICEAGSVEVIGRRQIEMYSRLIHTVDHVQGIMREGYDAIDAFLTHMWVVTVTGAPKLWAMQFIETHEKTPRRWYAGAVGWMGFDGNMSTGLVLRTVRLHQGIAELRTGATLLYDSDPIAEEKETALKASAFLDMLKNKDKAVTKKRLSKNAKNKQILLIDFEDSFVHCLANYFRQTGAEVITVRYQHALSYLNKNKFDLVVLSPGPGCPKDFKINQIISAVIEKKLPLFGVCLGLQAIVEYFGGKLNVLEYPMHGKASSIQLCNDSPLFTDLHSPFQAGRYHSLYASKKGFPEELLVTAETDDNIVMAISHREQFIHAIQFHPETILSLQGHAGIKIIHNLMDMVKNNA
jgi:anthranilate synthase